MNTTGTLIPFAVSPRDINAEKRKYFSSDTSVNWAVMPEYNYVFLLANQHYANDMLQSRGHVFLNEVYDMLGMPRTQLGALLGWTHPGSIDFGVTSENALISISLNFNIQGVIWNRI